MSWAPEVFVEGEWRRNALRFANRYEAEDYAACLFRRWTLTEGSRAAETDEPVNYRWSDLFRCPRCGTVSHNANDARERYCAYCHMFVDDSASQRAPSVP